MSDAVPAKHVHNPVDEPAVLPLVRLNALWFQVTGLLCNLECTHCLVDSSPKNKSMAFLSRDSIQEHLAEAESLGIKEIYFTGGEPFLHKEMVDILEDALRMGPTTVLTNGTLITERLAGQLGALARNSRYSLELRVSMDHPNPDRNDAVRGPGTHEKALRAILRLQGVGLLPIVTATEYLLDSGKEFSEEGTYAAFLRILSEAGVARPRLKIIPVFHTGKLEDSQEGGVITESMMMGMDPLLLQCAETRIITAQGIYACPILVGKHAALMTRDRLSNGLGPVTLQHHACKTCYDTGMTCGNF